MYKVYIAIFLSFVSHLNYAEEGTTNPLASFRWEHRIIVLHVEDSNVKSLTKMLSGSRAAIDERHVLWFLLSDTDLKTNFEGQLKEGFRDALKHYHNIQAGPEYRVLLVGKDGGVKAKQKNLKLQELFDRIDSMPMRRREMQEP
ncbi:MAG: DUF4174 domain-containing protein [Opitutales bacterium]